MSASKRRRIGFGPTILAFAGGMFVVALIGAMPSAESVYRDICLVVIVLFGFPGMAGLCIALAEWIDDLVLEQHDRPWHRLPKIIFIAAAVIVPVPLYLLGAIDLVELCLTLLTIGLFIGFRAGAAIALWRQMQSGYADTDHPCEL
jgi:hypothetical protein